MNANYTVNRVHYVFRLSGDNAFVYVNESDNTLTDIDRKKNRIQCVADQQLDKVPMRVECEVQVQSKYTKAHSSCLESATELEHSCM